MPKKKVKKKLKKFSVKKVKGSFNLPIQTVTLVPSTTSKDKKVKAPVLRKRVNETRRFLSKKFGGYTSVRSTGGFISNEGKTKGKLIKEKVVSVTSYSTKPDFKKGKKEWIDFVKKKGKKWGQESMGVIIENDLKYVKSKK